jgi:type II secretory pathway pseudopilin PulG
MAGDRAMNRKRNRDDRGLTLLEILLALIVLVIGIVGILALFPTALESARESMEYSQAAITGESVANAHAVSLRLATLDPSTGTWSATLSHDLRQGDSNGQRNLYKFPLPKLTEGLANSQEGTNWVHHPGKQAAAKLPEDQLAFEMGSDLWTAAILDEVRKTDPNDPLAQFAFSFRVRKIHSLAWLEGKMKPDGKPYTREDLDPISKLYEFQIFIFRMLGGSEDGKGQPKRLIAVLTTRVSTK